MSCIGNRRSTTPKIHYVDDRCVIGGAGALADIAVVVEKVHESGIYPCPGLLDIDEYPSAILLDVKNQQSVSIRARLLD